MPVSAGLIDKIKVVLSKDLVGMAADAWDQIRHLHEAVLDIVIVRRGAHQGGENPAGPELGRGDQTSRYESMCGHYHLTPSCRSVAALLLNWSAVPMRVDSGNMGANSRHGPCALKDSERSSKI